MTELVEHQPTSSSLETYMADPTGGRLVAWAQAASAANQLARALTSTTFVPQAFKGNPNDATAAILMGDELGLSPIAALRSIYVVHGAPALYARSMVALAQSQGHQVWTEATSDQRVIVCGRRRGSDHVERSEWTMDRARKAGYTGNKKYASDPQAMLYAKAASEVARKIAADVLAGVPHSVEDLELEDTAPATATVQRGGTQRVARKQHPAPAAPEPELEGPTPPAEPVAEDGITDKQMSWLQAFYKGVKREVRIAEGAAIVGREVESFSDLTKAEASTLIDALEAQQGAEQHDQDNAADAEADLFGAEQ